VNTTVAGKFAPIPVSSRIHAGTTSPASTAVNADGTEVDVALDVCEHPAAISIAADKSLPWPGSNPNQPPTTILELSTASTAGAKLVARVASHSPSLSSATTMDVSGSLSARTVVRACADSSWVWFAGMTIRETSGPSVQVCWTSERVLAAIAIGTTQ